MRSGRSTQPVRRLALRIACAAIIVSLSAVVATWGVSTGTAGGTGAKDVTTSGSSAHRSEPPAFPPVHVHPLALNGPDAVNPNAYYSSEPAPMGIGDFGIGAGGNPYTYNTSEFLGNFSWQTLNLSESGTTQFSDQLNVVLQFVQNGVTYAYWIQDVAFMDSATNALTFENNIWNFTSNCLNNSAVSGNGTVYPYSGCQGYYAVGATTQPGASLTMPSPGDFALLVRSYETGTGLPEVAFEYWDGVTSYYVTYDNVVFPWASGLSSDNNFVVDGFQYNPLGLFYDAELTIGGPGSASATQAQSSTHATSRLLYFNGHNFEAPPAVWNFGSNTAEAVSNIQSIFSNDNAGLPLTVQLNGTTRNATPAQAYGQNQVGELAISAPGVPDGTVSASSDRWSFVGGSATLTLIPGTYPVWVNSTSTNYDLGLCTVTAGVTTSVSVASGCRPVVSTPTATPTTVDVGQSATFQSTLLGAGSGGDTYVWDTSPAGLGCLPSSSLTLSCTPAAAGVYLVNLTATDSRGQSSTSGTLQFTVSLDPSVGTPSPSSTQVETGGTVSFAATPSGGAQPYSFQWHGLPTPCSQTATSDPSCTPSMAGSYSINVTVTDVNHFAVTSPTLSFTVREGPSVSTPTSAPVGSVDLGQAEAFSTSATGGSGGYTYTWSGLPAGCPSVSSDTLRCTPTSVGVYSISVSVIDSLGGTSTSGTLVFTVHSDPTIGTLTVSPKTIDLGQTFHFALSGPSTGGAGSYRYVWIELPPGCASNDSTTITCTPIAAVVGEATVTVYDADNGSNSTSVPWVIYIRPYLSGVTASPTSLDVGQLLTLSAVQLPGGSGIYTYVWTDLPTGCVSVNHASIECTPVQSGVFEIGLNLTDSNGLSSSRAITVHVDSDPMVSTPAAMPGSVHPGQSVTFSVNGSGGSGNLTYSWIGLPPGCASANTSSITCRPTAVGSYEVSVNLTDSNGFRVHSGSLSYAVTSSPTLGLTPLEEYTLLAEITAIALIVVAVVWIRRSRRRRRSSAS